MRCPTLTIIKNSLYIALVLYKLCRHTTLFVSGASLEYPKRPWFLGPSFPIVYRALEDSYLFFIFYLTLILLRLFQQHYCYNVTGQSQESEGSCKPARIKEVNSKLHSFQASLCTLTATHLTLIYVCTYIRLSVPLGCLIKQAGIIIHTILNMWETPGIEPVTSDLTSVYQISSSTN